MSENDHENGGVNFAENEKGCQLISVDEGSGDKVIDETTPLVESELISTSSADDAFGLEEEFTCSVCFDLVIMPTTLYCGHTFCRHCLAHWFETSKKLECPSCRKVIILV